MARIFQIVKKVTAGFTSANTTVTVKPAPSLAAVVNGVIAKAQLATGIGLSQSPARFLTQQAPAPSLAPLVSGSTRVDLAPAPQAKTVMALQAVPANPGPQQTVYITLTGTYGATSAANTTNAGNAWSNPANAQGAHNGTLASHPGNLLNPQDAWLTFTFPTFPNKSALTITAAKLRYWCKQGGTVLGNGNLQLRYGTAVDPGATQALLITGDADYTAAPYEVDLFALGYTTWASLEALRARIRGQLGAGTATVTQDVDAVEIVVTANA